MKKLDSRPVQGGTARFRPQFLVQVHFPGNTAENGPGYRHCGASEARRDEHMIDQCGSLSDLGVRRNDAEQGRKRSSYLRTFVVFYVNVARSTGGSADDYPAVLVLPVY